MNLIDSKPTDVQLKSYEYMIRALRDLPTERIVFTFMNPLKKDCGQSGLVFCQVERGKQDSIVAEIRLDTLEGRRIHRLVTDDDRAIAILHEIIKMDRVPDLSDWQDITELIC